MGKDSRSRSVVLALLALLALMAAGVLGGAACKKSGPDPLEVTPIPQNAASSRAAVGSKRFTIDASGRASVGIDAPLERFKGETTKLSGVIDVDPRDLTRARGEILADLDAFATTTFRERDKDEAQTEHARNWFELGNDVDPKTREDYRMARFTIEQVEKAEAPGAGTVKSLADVPEKDGTRTVVLTVSGQLRVHGRMAKKKVVVEVAFDGPPDAPKSLTFRTLEPIGVSLAEHDVKPRDTAGKFLAGALEKIGKKLDDRAILAVDGSAHS